MSFAVTMIFLLAEKNGTGIRFCIFIQFIFGGVPLHFIPGQAAPDSAAAPLLSFRFAPLQQRLRRLAHP